MQFVEMPEADSVFRARSDGISAEGVRDQYADGKAAKVWKVYIGDKSSRTDNYRQFLVNLLREKGCKRILDTACGTGIDSIMLVEEGFEVVSVDASDKMLKYALKERWNRRHEKGFDKWVIEEANWLTVAKDIEPFVNGGFDAVLCLGNSFAHMLDSFGDQREQKRAIQNFKECVKPGGLLLIDHRNYDYIMNTGCTPPKCIYYNSKHTSDIKTSVLYIEGKPYLITLDYLIDTGDEISEFRLSYYPHKLDVFSKMLTDVFGTSTKHEIYGDFKQLKEIDVPGFYIHLIEKST
ncbi:glycine N-methyltransferase isoform X2 [Bradysia coprophila]|nr:glycine N-methyltransferase isoform X2 [Bradysia coprophila]